MPSLNAIARLLPFSVSPWELACFISSLGETETESMGVGQLSAAAVKERRRRLLAGTDITAAVRRPGRVQIGAFVDRAGLMTDAAVVKEERHCLLAGADMTAAVGCRPGGSQIGAVKERRRCLVAGADTTAAVRRPGALVDGGHLSAGSGEETRWGAYVVVLGRNGHATGTILMPLLSQPNGELADSELDSQSQPPVSPLTTNITVDSHDERQGSGEETRGGAYVVAGRNGHTTHMVHMPLLSQPSGELAESELDSQPPVSPPLTTNITVDSHDDERQRIDPCSKGNLQSQQLTPIFVRHISGELVFAVNLEQPSDHLMQLYATKTKTKIECQYFVCGSKKLEPHGSLMSYGIERDSTIHVCTRLLGGVMTISQFLLGNQSDLMTEVTLPNKSVSLKMTKAGCLFLSTWLKCFTRAFAASRTWNGEFTLDDFRVKHGHVLVINSAEKRLDSSSMHADLKKLVSHINAFFYRNQPNLTSKFAPYIENLTGFLLKLKLSVLLDTDRLFIETHICCVESAARGTLLIMLRRKQKTLDKNEQKRWDRASELTENSKTAYVDYNKLSNIAMFDDIIEYAISHNEEYSSSRHSTFRLMRDGYMHSPSKRFDKTSEPWTEKFKNDDGIELMIPAYNPNLVPEIIYNWINDNKIDIKPELLAAQVRCTCVLCHPAQAHSGSKGKGESSMAGKGKQLESGSSGSSQSSTPSSRQRPSAWPQSQEAPSSRIPQYVAPRPPAPAPQRSSSSEWHTQKGKGKGKRYG